MHTTPNARLIAYTAWQTMRSNYDELIAQAARGVPIDWAIMTPLIDDMNRARELFMDEVKPG